LGPSLEVSRGVWERKREKSGTIFRYVRGETKRVPESKEKCNTSKKKKKYRGGTIHDILSGQNFPTKRERPFLRGSPEYGNNNEGRKK